MANLLCFLSERYDLSLIDKKFTTGQSSKGRALSVFICLGICVYACGHATGHNSSQNFTQIRRVIGLITSKAPFCFWDTRSKVTVRSRRNSTHIFGHNFSCIWDRDFQLGSYCRIRECASYMTSILTFDLEKFARVNIGTKFTFMQRYRVVYHVKGVEL